MDETPYVGEIRMFAGNFEPAGWAFCDGRELSISENDTLFNLIGTTYGGDGVNTFALPDLRGRAPLHASGLYNLGEPGGTEYVTLSGAQLPPHRHTLAGTVSVPAYAENPGKLSVPDNTKSPAITSGPNQFSTSMQTPAAFMRRLSVPVTGADSTGTMLKVEPTGQSYPFTNRQPYLVVNFIISLYGIYPTQS